MVVSFGLVLFDIGGVILRTDNPGPRTRLAQRFGMDRDAIDRLVFGNPVAQAAEIGQADEPAVWEHVRAALGLDGPGLQAFITEFWAGDSFDVSMLELMRLIHPRVRVGMLTNSWMTEPVKIFTGRLGLPAELFSAVIDDWISSAQVGIQKPDRRIFEHALGRFAVSPDQAVLIDDFAVNVEAARAMGMRAILFESPTQARRDLLTLLGQ